MPFIYKKKLVLLMVLLMLCEEPEKVKKRIWTKQWLLERERFSHLNLVNKLRECSAEDLKNYLRMDQKSFQILLKLIKPYILKKNTKMRRAISAEERLLLTLRYLATGRNFEDLKFSAVVSAQAIGKIVPETCRAIYKALKKDYLKMPKTEEEWLQVANDFESRWNFPNCGGSIDGKHVRIVKPPNSGSYFFNYKDYFSIVLMAVVNADYEFMYVNVGCNGRNSDGGVIETTKFYDKLLSGTLNLPNNNQTKKNMNFVFVSDDAFSLNQHILKPYSPTNQLLTAEQKIFNYRLSRARRTVENAFGILANRFRVFHTAINMKVEKIEWVVLAACALHNYLRRNSGKSYAPRDFIDSEDLESGVIVPGNWRQQEKLDGLKATLSKNVTQEAKSVRDSYKTYFMNEGKVSWQNNFM